MIIFGTRGVTSTLSDGSSYCPNCNGEMPYRLRRVRRFFTLYFIPIIPLDVLGEYVECQQCKNTFQPEILDFTPEQIEELFEPEYLVALRRVMVETMLADGTQNDTEIQAIRDLYFEFAGSEFTSDRLNKELAQAEKNSVDAVRQMSPSLNTEGKELVLVAAFRVAISDGELVDEEWAILAELGDALELTAEQIDRVIQNAETKYLPT